VVNVIVAPSPGAMNISFDCGAKTLIFETRIWNPYAMEGVDNGVAVYGSEGMVQIGRAGSVRRRAQSGPKQ
jgi:hypothetical protein